MRLGRNPSCSSAVSEARIRVSRKGCNLTHTCVATSMHHLGHVLNNGPGHPSPAHRPPPLLAARPRLESSISNVLLHEHAGYVCGSGVLCGYTGEELPVFNYLL
jgi:hypothetical protein